MTRRRRSFLAIPLLVVVALLSACAAQTPKAVSHTGDASPHPSPTKHADPLPVVRVPIKCADLFAASGISGMVGATVTLREDETSAATDLDEVAARQLGTLACVWGGTGKTDGGYDQGLQLYIAPDSAAEFASNLPAIEASQSPTAENTAGDASEYQCSVAATGASTDSDLQCTANMLVGSDWVTAYLQGDGAGVTQTTVNSEIQQIMDTAAKAIRQAGPAHGAWTPPPSDAPGFCSDQNSTSAVRTAFSSAGLVATNDRSGMVYDADTIAQSDSSYAACYWQQQNIAGTPAGQYSDVQVETLRAGSWAFPGFAAAPPTDWYVGAYAPVTIGGSPAAMLACNGADCSALIQVGTTALQVLFENLGTSRTMASLTGLVNAIRLG